MILEKKILLILILVVGMTNDAAYADDAKTSQSASQIASSNVHPLAIQLTNMGALNCVARANQIARFLTGPSNGTTYIPKPPDNPDKRLLASNLIIPIKNNEYSLATLALAPNQANGCGGSYQTINYENVSCEKAVSTKYSNFEFVTITSNGVQLGEIGIGSWVIAMPAGLGCNLIKEEIVN